MKVLLKKALGDLRAEGLPEQEIEALLTEPVDPRRARIYGPLSGPNHLGWLIEQTMNGDPEAEWILMLEIREHLRRKTPLPACAQDYLLNALENRDLKALGITGAPNRDPINEDQLRWARSRLVCYVAKGDHSKENSALEYLHDLLGYSSAKKLLENCRKPLRQVPLWGSSREDLASEAVMACRTLMELKPEKDYP